MRRVKLVMQPSLLSRYGVTRLLSVSAPLQEKYINNVQLLGRVGRDPEQRGDARPIVTFPLATTLTIRHSSEGDHDEGGSEKSITSWHNIIIGSPPFQRYVQDYVTKGCRLIVNGSLNYYKSTLPDGTMRVSANIKAKEIIVLSTPRQEGESRGPQYVEEFETPPETELG